MALKAIEQERKDAQEMRAARKALEEVFGRPLTTQASAALEAVVSLQQNGL